MNYAGMALMHSSMMHYFAKLDSRVLPFLPVNSKHCPGVHCSGVPQVPNPLADSTPNQVPLRFFARKGCKDGKEYRCWH
jgi:hypothetical protein